MGGGTYDFQTNWLFGSIHPAWKYLQLSPRTLNHMATLRHGETWPLSSITFHEKTSIKCSGGPLPSLGCRSLDDFSSKQLVLLGVNLTSLGVQEERVHCFGDRLGNCFQHRGCEGFWILVTLVETASAERYGALR